jgi:hypothetical protein
MRNANGKRSLSFALDCILQAVWLLYADSEMGFGVPRRELAVMKQTVYQGPVFTVEQYRWQLPSRDEIVRDIVERPESGPSQT